MTKREKDAVIKKLQKLFPTDIKTTKVKMRYIREISNFIERVQKAHKATSKSKLRFKKKSDGLPDGVVRYKGGWIDLKAGQAGIIF